MNSILYPIAKLMNEGLDLSPYGSTVILVQVSETRTLAFILFCYGHENAGGGFKDGKGVEHWRYMQPADMMKMMPPQPANKMDDKMKSK